MYRLIEMNGETVQVFHRRAASLVSRGLAVYTSETPKRRGRPKGSRNKPKEPAVFAEQVFADPTSPVTPVHLPGPTLGDATDNAENKPPTFE